MQRASAILLFVPGPQQGQESASLMRKKIGRRHVTQGVEKG
jgi:hypothetical protein